MSTQNINETITSISTSNSGSNNHNINETTTTSTDTSNSISQSTNHNTNVSNSTSNETSNSHSTSDNHNTNVTSSTSNDTSNVTSQATNHNTNVTSSTSNDTSTSTSIATTNNTSVTTANNTNNDVTTTTSTVTTSSNSIASNTNNSPSDVEVANINATASNYQADRILDGVVAHEAAETTRLSMKLAFSSSTFNAILPLLTSVASTGSSSSGGGGIGFTASARPTGLVAQGSGEDFTAQGGMGMGFYSRTTTMGFKSRPPMMGGGDVKRGGIGFASGASVADAVAATNLPFISTSGVLSPAQVQQAVNAAYARNDTRTQSETRKLVSDMTGRGFSPNSPILSALRVGLAGQNLRSSLEGATQIQLDSAKLNSEAVFAAQKAVADQFAQQESVLLEHEKNGISREVGVLSAVAQIVSGSL